MGPLREITRETPAGVIIFVPKIELMAHLMCGAFLIMACEIDYRISCKPSASAFITSGVTYHVIVFLACVFGALGNGSQNVV
jgi:hypothetical protein